MRRVGMPGRRPPSQEARRRRRGQPPWLRLLPRCPSRSWHGRLRGPRRAPPRHVALEQSASAHRTPWRGIAIIAVAAFAVEMAVSARYGYVRDELYFLSAGRHLAFGYVDQPPLTPLLARAAAEFGGNTLVALRLVPALGLAALV